MLIGFLRNCRRADRQQAVHGVDKGASRPFAKGLGLSSGPSRIPTIYDLQAWGRQGFKSDFCACLGLSSGPSQVTNLPTPAHPSQRSICFLFVFWFCFVSLRAEGRSEDGGHH